MSSAAPDEHRGATISAFFVTAYVGISLPVVGVGALTLSLGLRNAGLVFAACVVLLASAVVGFLWRRSRLADALVRQRQRRWALTER